MNIFFKCIIALTFLSTLSFAEKNSDGLAEFATAIKQAQLTDRPIFLQVSTTWCGWCKRLDKYLKSNTAVKSKLSENMNFVKSNLPRNLKQASSKTLPFQQRNLL
ncbi:MAG: thioredoxin family protein [Lentisphaeria bacterium]|nr:thioredoxin family protein [Lentisphaeria bacterium]